MNNITIIGRLTSDPEFKQTPDNISLCRFTVAVSRPNVKGKTDFIPCVAWRAQAEFVNKYFSKGKPIAVVGVLTSNSYEKDGKKTTWLEVCANMVEFVPSDKQQQTAPTEQAELPADLSGFEEITSGALPF